MNKILAIGLLLSVSGVVFAQEGLVGKYTGGYTQKTNTGDRQVGLTVEITSVEGGTVKGKAVRMAGGSTRSPCAGEYPVEGTVKDSALVLRATEKGGAAGDCAMTLRLTAEGNKLVGTMNSAKAELSK